MFWIGFVVGHNVGLTCGLMLLNSLLFGAVGSYAVVQLERISKGERVTRSKAKRSREAEAPLPKPALRACMATGR